ncbi:MAG: hypothetical protein R3342_13285 [Lutibacter sp.]|uniref:hypothetical protein n=1 Tax=Lutibacter sp. TaxID=1925666 RepID=UPI00299E85E3|nr:hypothetical protein [Lutibacter sp.]MDX1830507.1 hypothetical protein [Lutibacter sp.]
MIKKFAIYFIPFTLISLLLNLIFENFIGKSIFASVLGGIIFAGLMVLIQRKNEQS